MAAPGSAVLLDHTGVSDAGVVVDFKLKAWCDSNGQLRWELRRVLPACGYHWTNKWTRVCDTVKGLLPTWTAWWSLAGLSLESCFGRSARSVASTPGTIFHELSVAEQEFWFSTPALLTCLANQCNHRKALADKARCKGVLQSLLERTCPLDALLHARLGDMAEATKAECDAEPKLNGSCHCCQPWQHSFVGVQLHSHRSLVDVLVNLAKLAHCKACMTHVGLVSQAIAMIIDGRRLEWGTPISLTIEGAWMPGLSGKKRRRSDAHAREQVAQAPASSSTGSAATVLSTATADGNQVRRWRDQLMCGLQAAAHLAFKAPAILSTALDATRLGQPAVDMLMHVVWRFPGGCSVVLPPAACPFVTVKTKVFASLNRHENARTAKTVKSKSVLKQYVKLTAKTVKFSFSKPNENAEQVFAFCVTAKTAKTVN
jgi:hypothetical protein